jgi:hypothetical protein
MPTHSRRSRSPRTRLLRVRILSFALPALVACSRSTQVDVPPAPDSGAAVDAGPLTIEGAARRDLTDLTLEERKQLCDWTANVGGGYGKRTSCSGGVTVANARDQFACLESYPSACHSVLVSEWESCRRKEIVDPCATLLFSSPECRGLRLCMGQTDGGPPRAPRSGG